MDREEYRILYLLLAKLLNQESSNADLVGAIGTVMAAILDLQPVA